MGFSEFLAEIFPVSPYEGYDPSPFPLDLQGWGSEHPMFARLIDETHPELIIEVGSWKGASAIHMAKLAKAHKPGCRIICIDTWTASGAKLWLPPPPELQIPPDAPPMYLLRNGFPDVYWRFLSNVVLTGNQDCILPLPVTSSCAAEILSHYGIMADMVYIDCGHQEEDVARDIRAYWNMLRPGGYMMGDDYIDAWPGVVKAVMKFCGERGLRVQSNREKWCIRRRAPAPKKAP
jgi:hypothetical protein